MDRVVWNLLRAFLATAEAGSLSAAARRLGLTQPTLSRQVAAVEAALGVTLFERVGKSTVLTATGLDLLEHARAMGAAAGALCMAATGRSQAVEGVVTVSAGEIVASCVLPALLPRLRTLQPGITVEVIASDAVSDLRRREADIAIRHVQPHQGDLIARLIGHCEAHFYAARAWVAANGHPRTAHDAAHADFVGSDRGGRYLAYLRALDLPVAESSFSCYGEAGCTHWALVCQGMGIGAMMHTVAAATPGVVRVLDELPPIRFPLWLVTHRELRTSRRIRLVYDYLAEQLARPTGAA